MIDRQPENPNFTPNINQPSRVLSVKWAYRWDVYRRLQALEIDCRCSTNEPLLVDLHSPTTLVQIWSVLRQSSADRCQLIDWLNNCWYLDYDHRSNSSYSNYHDQSE
ncbi:MAG: Asr1405/Asl0597 family protein [Cyanobacteria bacterium P01_G01_bin.67]